MATNTNKNTSKATPNINTGTKTEGKPTHSFVTDSTTRKETCAIRMMASVEENSDKSLNTCAPFNSPAATCVRKRIQPANTKQNKNLSNETNVFVLMFMCFSIV